MRKILIFLGVLAILGLMMIPAQANELLNGDFSSGLANWTQGNLHTSIGAVAGGQWVPGQDETEACIYQTVNEADFPGWNPNYSRKEYWFSFDATATLTGTVEAYLYAYTPAGTPTAFGDPDGPGVGWTKIIEVDLDTIGTNVHYAYHGILDYQPQYLAVAFESSLVGSGTAAIDNAVLDGQCIIPVPPAVWLFGSGLLGLVGWRRFKS